MKIENLIFSDAEAFEEWKQDVLNIFVEPEFKHVTYQNRLVYPDWVNCECTIEVQTQLRKTILRGKTHIISTECLHVVVNDLFELKEFLKFAPLKSDISVNIKIYKILGTQWHENVTWSDFHINAQKSLEQKEGNL